MVAADLLSRPYRFGGWGILDMEVFNTALRLKSAWRGIFGNTLWSKIIHSKYIKMDTTYWIRNPKVTGWNFSPMWRGFMKIFHWIKKDLIWQVGSGRQTRIGIDPIVGLDLDFSLPDIIPQYLHIIGLSTLDKICHRNVENSSHQYWFSSQDIGLTGYLAGTWDLYIKKLCAAGVYLDNKDDKLLWGGNPTTGSVTARSAYNRILQEKFIFLQDWWYKRVWHWDMPTKLKCFTWLLLQNKLKTWDNLCNRGWIGPSLCYLCRSAAENRQHLFVHCDFSRKIWAKVAHELKVTHCWESGNFNQCFLDWYRHVKQHFFLAVCIPWAIWYTRNSTIFQNSLPDPYHCSILALKMLSLCKVDKQKIRTDKISILNLTVNQPVLFFDGASQSGICAVGGIIYLNESHYFTFKLNCGSGTNMKAELMALWCVLRVANIFGLVNLKVFGDSRVTIKWAIGDFKLNVLSLRHWASRTLLEITKQHSIKFEHIYREHNSFADKLSKQALAGSEGHLIWEEWFESSLLDGGSLFFLD